MLAANQAPVNSVPGAQTSQVDLPYAFTQYRGNLISISDADAGENVVRITLSVDKGTITLLNPDPNGGLTYSAGDGTEDASMTFVGTVADINTALQWVSYRPQASFTGVATFTITTNDLGNVGTGGAKTDTDTIAITVNPAPAFAPSPTHETLPGVLDTSFNRTGKQVLAISDRTAGIDYLHEMRVLADGKILGVGAIDDRFGIMRFNPDMTLDKSFGTAWQSYGLKVGGGTTVLDFGFGVHANSLAIDSEGRIVVGGGDKVVRLTATGMIDTTFGTDGVCSDVAPIVAIRADGSILATGQTNPLTIPGMSVYRISASGEKLDSWSYDPLGFDYDYARAIIPFDDGDAVIAGRASRQDHYFDYGFYTARIDATGGLEQEFNAKFRPDSQPYSSPFINSALAIPDGRFLAVGVTYGNVAVSRHLASGRLDTTFGDNGLTRIPVLSGAGTGTGYRATLTPDGKILVAGSTHNGVDQDVAVVRLDFDGRIDSTFGIEGALIANLGSDDLGYAVASLPDGKILVAGRSGNRIALVRLQGDSDPATVPALPEVAPHQLRVHPGNMANEIWVSWELPDTLNVPFIQDYFLEVSANNGETWRRVEDGVSLSRYTSLPNLDSTLSYSVRVAAVSETGVGRWSWPSAAVRPLAPVINLVHVGNPGNSWDTANLASSQGDVLYEYRIGAYEITIKQYVEFLNAVARTDTGSLYNPNMATDLKVAGITRQGSEGSYSYSVMNNSGSSAGRPITYVSWFDAARFANWLHNGRPIGIQGPGTTETGAYTLAGMVSGIPPALNQAARFFIPTNDQWYKAAYYDPDLDSGDGGFWAYATQSNSHPGNKTGSLPNQANLVSGGFALNGTTAVGAFSGSGSHYGTFDQNGNVAEWTSWAVGGDASSQRAIRGSSYKDSVGPGFTLVRDRIIREVASYEGPSVGFRLAAPFDPQSFNAVKLLNAPIAEHAAGSGSWPVVAWRMQEPVADIELTGFVVQQSNDAGKTWITVETAIPSDRRSYEFAQLANGGAYLLRVAASGPGGVGAFSEPVSFTTVNDDTGDWTVDVDSGASVDIAILRSGPNEFTKKGRGTIFLVGANTHTGGTVIEAGTAIVRNSAALGAGRLTVKAGATLQFDIGTDSVILPAISFEPGSRVDLGFGSMNVALGGFDIESMVARIQAGRGDGDWAGWQGITSRHVPSLFGGGVGYNVHGDGSITVGYAAKGDTNLDGIVDMLDAANILSAGKMNTNTASTWSEGDFNYDGVFDILDVADFVGSGLFEKGSYRPSQASQSEMSVIAMSAVDAAFVAFATDSTTSTTTSKTKKARFASLT